MTPVKSSNLAAVHHDGAHLKVQFTNGATWRYADVPASKYEAMLSAPSVGGYFHKHIRSHYKGEKVV